MCSVSDAVVLHIGTLCKSTQSNEKAKEAALSFDETGVACSVWVLVLFGLCQSIGLRENLEEKKTFNGKIDAFL